MSTTNKKLKFGKLDVLPNEPFDPKQVKIRISIMLDGDILEAARARASKLHMRYQTYINKALRESILDETTDSASANIERRVKALEDKISRIRSAEMGGAEKKRVA